MVITQPGQVRGKTERGTLAVPRTTTRPQARAAPARVVVSASQVISPPRPRPRRCAGMPRTVLQADATLHGRGQRLPHAWCSRALDTQPPSSHGTTCAGLQACQVCGNARDKPRQEGVMHATRAAGKRAAASATVPLHSCTHRSQHNWRGRHTSLYDLPWALPNGLELSCSHAHAPMHAPMHAPRTYRVSATCGVGVATRPCTRPMHAQQPARLAWRVIAADKHAAPYNAA